jgi:transcriptional antiterminator NusG
MKNKLFKNLGKKRRNQPRNWLTEFSTPKRGHRPKPKEWRQVDETTPLEPAPAATGWVVLMVEPRMEAKAATALRDAGYVAWFPQTVEETKDDRRKIRRKVNRPLFPRYLFAGAAAPAGWLSDGDGYGDAGNAGLRALSRLCGPAIGMGDCDHVSAIIGPVPAALLADLSSRQGDGEFVKDDGKAKQFGPGAAVRVTDGAWAAFQGIVERHAKDRIRILLDIFGRPTPVEVGIEQVEAA